MKLKLFDYRNNVKEFEIGNIENINAIYICVLSGDEVATVIYKDGHRKVFDASDGRCTHFFDAHYELYVDGIINRLEEPEFVNRTS